MHYILLLIFFKKIVVFISLYIFICEIVLKKWEEIQYFFDDHYESHANWGIHMCMCLCMPTCMYVLNLIITGSGIFSFHHLHSIFQDMHNGSQERCWNITVGNWARRFNFFLYRNPTTDIWPVNQSLDLNPQAKICTGDFAVHSDTHIGYLICLVYLFQISGFMLI